MECREECSITGLPMDVHLLIRDELVKHAETTFDDFKAYRTVCKFFDDVWSPIVMSSVSLFPLLPSPIDGNNIHTQFQYIIDAPERFASTRTISIKNWHSLNIDFSPPGVITQAWKSSVVEGMMTTLALLIFGPPVELVKTIAHPLDVADRVKKLWWTFKARKCATVLPQRLNLPNVRCARLFFHYSETKWIISSVTRTLLVMPELTELELCISGEAKTLYMSKCLKQITSLRRFTLRTYAVSAKSYTTFHQDIESFKVILARNPNLTHLSLLTAYGKQFDLSELFRDIPVDCPLKLEYLALSNDFSPCEALLPHIRTLKTFSFCAIHDTKSWCRFFTQASVFPPNINVAADSFTFGLLTYLVCHPALTSLSVDNRFENPNMLSTVLTQHSRTLRSLMITNQTLATMLATEEYRDNFRKCTNMQELVLYHHDAGKIRHEELILSQVARLNNSLLLVLTHKGLYSQYVQHCLKSFSFYERDLADRIVYERR